MYGGGGEAEVLDYLAKFAVFETHFGRGCVRGLWEKWRWWNTEVDVHML